MLRYFFFFVLAMPLCTGAAEIRIGVADQHGSALKLKDGRFAGVLAKAYQCPLDRIGLNLKMLSMPHARVLLQLERGEVDIAMPLVRLDRRDQYAAFSKPLYEIEFALFSLKPINPEQDLSDYSFAVLRSSAGVDLVQQRNGNVIEVNSWTQALELARLNRFDGAVVAMPGVANLTPEDFKGMQRSLFGWLQIGFYVSQAIPNSDEIMQQLNIAIDACRS